MKKYKHFNRNIFSCFIDFIKALDNVNYCKLINTLKKKNIDGHDIRIILNIYWNQIANIKVDDEFIFYINSGAI